MAKNRFSPFVYRGKKLAETWQNLKGQITVLGFRELD